MDVGTTLDPLRVATKTISGLHDGATTAELDRLSIQTAAEMIGEEPQYSRLAARLLSGYIDKEVRGQGIASFSQAIRLGHAEGLIGDETAAFVQANARKLDDAIDPAADLRFEYFGLRTVYDRYLLRHPGVAQVSAVGAPHPEWGEEVVAFVVSLPGACVPQEELDALCLDNIARYKRPRRYVFVDDLPKNNYGKVLKTALRAQLERKAC